MHDTVMAFVARTLSPDLVNGKRVLEVGSYNVNGSVRPYIESLGPSEYIGVDMREGPGVDLVLNAGSLVEYFGPYRFDIVVCAEVLEHVEDWRSAVQNMKEVLQTDGLLVLTTRSYGFPLHEYPGDYWRFEIVDMVKIFADMDIVALEPDTLVAGVFVSARTIDDGENKSVELYNINVRAMEQP